MVRSRNRRERDMKTILLFPPRYPPYRGGSSTYFSQLLESIDEYRFVVITYYHPDAPIVTLEDGNSIYRIIPKFERLPDVLRAAIESLVSLLMLTWVAASDQIDVAHVHAASFATPGFTVGSLLWRLPIVYDCRDEMFPPALVKIGRTKYWFSCGSNIDAILKDTGIPEENIVRTPVANPPYVSEYVTEDVNDGPFTVIFVGRLIESKGIHLLIESFSEFVATNPESRLVLVGDDPNDTARRNVEAFDIPSKVEIRGELPHHETIEELATADVLVLPSVSEGVPRAILEAFELGVPVIATPVGGIPDVITNEETGLLVNHTSDSITRALSRVHGNASLRAEIERNAREFYQSRNWETVETRVRATYRNILDY